MATDSAPPSTPNSLTARDLMGGLAGTAVALPQSMGLGVALFLTMGFDASAGALAGLVGAAQFQPGTGCTGYRASRGRPARRYRWRWHQGLHPGRDKDRRRTLGFDLMVGVGVGVVGSVLLFVHRHANAPLVHDRLTGKDHHSLLYRSEEERELLDKHGDSIVYIELRGNLFFGTADRLFTELMPDLNRPVLMILNMRRVQSMDMSGLNLFRQMIKRLDAHGGKMIYSNVRKSGAKGRKMHKILRWLEPDNELPKVKTFKSTDAALEFAEDKLLQSLGCEPARRIAGARPAVLRIARKDKAARSGLGGAARNWHVISSTTALDPSRIAKTRTLVRYAG